MTIRAREAVVAEFLRNALADEALGYLNSRHGASGGIAWRR